MLPRASVLWAFYHFSFHVGGVQLSGPGWEYSLRRIASCGRVATFMWNLPHAAVNMHAAVHFTMEPAW